MKKNLTLVDCEPYRARLTLASCIDRHARAEAANLAPNTAGGQAIARAQTLGALGHCVGCSVGAERTKEAEP